MIAWLSGLLSGAWAKIAAGAAGVAAAAGAVLLIRREGQQSQQISDLKQGENERAKADTIRAADDQLGGSALDDKLRGYQRKQ